MDAVSCYKGYQRGGSAQGAYDFYRNNGDTQQDMYDFSPYLREVAKGYILEIGVAFGISTAAFLCGVEERGGQVLGVDLDSYCGDTYPDHPQFTFIQANSVTQADIIKEAIKEPLDILFIDGDHSYEAVKSDLENFAPLVRSGGLIILHDTDLNYYTGPTTAINEFLAVNPWPFEAKEGRYGLGVITKI